MAKPLLGYENGQVIGIVGTADGAIPSWDDDGSSWGTVNTLGAANGGTGLTPSISDVGKVIAVAAGGTSYEFVTQSGGGGGGGSNTYDLMGQANGTPSTNEVIARYRAARAFTISDDETKHIFSCLVRPSSGSVAITVHKIAASTGTKSAVFAVTFASNAAQSLDLTYPGSIGTVSSANSVAAGDLITVECGTTNSAFDTPIWTIFGTLT
jgi:hypothetical protein